MTSRSLTRIYDRFNARDIDGVLTVLTEDVAWANGMDGGHVHGREAVRAYWTRQWTMVSPHVQPVGFHRTADGAIIAEVRQSVRDLEGKPSSGADARVEGQDGWTRLPSSRGQGGSLRHSGCCLVSQVRPTMHRDHARLIPSPRRSWPRHSAPRKTRTRSPTAASRPARRPSTSPNDKCRHRRIR